MFGKIRGCSSSSLENLENQRFPPKLLKEDSLSIYEATLVKLKLGSQRKIGSTSSMACVDPMNIETSSCVTISENISGSEVMPIDNDLATGCYSPKKFPSCEERDKRPGSIVYMFSKFKNTHQQPDNSSTSLDSKSVSMETCFSSFNSLDGSAEHRSEQGFVNSLPVANS